MIYLQNVYRLAGTRESIHTHLKWYSENLPCAASAGHDKRLLQHGELQFTGINTVTPPVVLEKPITPEYVILLYLINRYVSKDFAIVFTKNYAKERKTRFRVLAIMNCDEIGPSLGHCCMGRR